MITPSSNGKVSCEDFCGILAGNKTEIGLEPFNSFKLVTISAILQEFDPTLANSVGGSPIICICYKVYFLQQKLYQFVFMSEVNQFQGWDPLMEAKL